MSASHLGDVGISPLNPRRRQLHAKPVLSHAAAAAVQRGPVQLAVDQEHREGPTPEKLKRRRCPGPPNHAPATPFISPTSIGHLHYRAPPPSRHGLREEMKARHLSPTTVKTSAFFASEEDGAVDLRWRVQGCRGRDRLFRGRRRKCRWRSRRRRQW